jgi:peptidyl-prolyl cis-trans isomerase D
VLDIIRRGQRWVTALFVVGVGGAMIFFIGLGGPLQGGDPNAVVRVGPHEFTYVEFQRELANREQQYQEALGDGFDPEAMRDQLTQMAARGLVDRALLAMGAEDLGMAVSRQEVERSVLSWGAFRDEGGRFDREAFKDWADYEYGSQRNFMQDQRMRMLAVKMARLLFTNARVSEAELRGAVERRLQQVKLAFVVLEPGDRLLGETQVDDAAVEALLGSRELDVRALYDERSDRYDVPERVHARHILLSLSPDADEATVEEARVRAQGLVEQLRGGADFAELAAEHSEDPGSRDKGGDLGFFERGRMVPQFEEAAFALEPGTVSDPVKSDFGFHVIRVEQHDEARVQNYESVREELARDLLITEASQEANRVLAEELAEAVREGQSLEDAARAKRLTLERTDWIRRRPDGYVPGLGAAQDLLAAAFMMETGQSSDHVFEVDDRLALVEVLEAQQPSDEDVTAQMDSERERLIEEKRGTQTEAWIDTYRADLAASGEIMVNLDLVQ